MEGEAQTFLQLMNELEVIEKLERGTIEQFCKVFKVDDSSGDEVVLKKKLKLKIADILITEADTYKDYLSLRKFSVLSSDDTKKMFAVFADVWRAFQMLKKKESWAVTQKELEEMIPVFNNWQEMERFHHKLFNLYKSSNFANLSTESELTKIQAEQNKPQVENHFMSYPTMGYNGSSMAQPMYPPPPYFFPFQPPPQNIPPQPTGFATKIQQTDEKPIHIDNFQNIRQKQGSMLPQMNYSPQIGGYYQPPHIGFQGQYRNRFKDHLESQKKKRGPKKRQPEQFEQKPASLSNAFQSKFNKNMSQLESQFSKYRYIQCVCQGNPSTSVSESVVCHRCNFSYHLKCLNLDQKSFSMEMCPLCKLRRGSIISKVKEDPIKMSWFHNQKGKKLSIELTDDLIKKLSDAKDKKLQTRLRFLKIDGSTLLANKASNILQQQHPSPTKHNDIELPELSLNSEPFKIQISIRADEDDHKASMLYFFGIFIVQSFNIDSVAQAYMDDVKNAQRPEFYEKFRDENGAVRISLRDDFDRLFFYPVRGNLCDHIQVFDLKGVIEIALDMRKQTFKGHQCPFCNRICETFYVETLAWSRLPDTMAELQNMSVSAIIVQRNGEFHWQYEEQEEQKDYQSNNGGGADEQGKIRDDE